MKQPFSISGKHVAVFGAGRSGIAACKLALREGAKVSIWDERGEEAFVNVPEGVEIHPALSESAASNFSADLIVISPGIDTYSVMIQAFAAEAPIIGETELASKFYSGDIIGITGTNGKTTTTELVSRILKHAGLGGTPCGNYGAPLSEVVLGSEIPAAVALELSSFQLETIDQLRPVVAVWLNFAPDHMDRYPSVDDYKKAKLRIFKNQTSRETVVSRFGEDLGALASRVVSFTTDPQEVDSADFFSDGKTITFEGQVILNLENETSLRGLHNAENAMAAIAACKAYGLDSIAFSAAIAGYTPPPHRCELIRTLDGVEYLNDSKATNLHALESALRSQTRPVILIAGGKEKGLDYTPLLPLLKKHSLESITFGQIAKPLADCFGAAHPSTSFETIEEAVSYARSIAPRGSTVILSPGTSSFDQFSGYEQRGDTFRNIVNQLS